MSLLFPFVPKTMLHKVIPNYRNQRQSKLKDRIRQWFGVKVDRALPEAGPRPHVGDYIARDRYAMKLTEPVADELWDWLTFARWRRIDPARDRRRYYKLPRDSFRKLVRCSPQERAPVMQEILQNHSLPDTQLRLPK